MTRFGTLALVTAMLAVVGCSTAIQLTDRGRLVNHITRADMPSGCNLLGDVAIGIPPDAARPRTEADLVILMRNKTAEVGGNTLLVDDSEQLEDSSGSPYFRGRGIAYACPAPEPETTGSAGGEEGGAQGEGAAGDEAEGAGEGEGGEGSGDDDAMMEDLLGE